MVARMFTLVMLPPFIAASITLMIVAPSGPVQGRLLVFMAMLVIFTMTLRGISLYREGKDGPHQHVGKVPLRKKYPKPRVASDLGRSIALGICSLLILSVFVAGAMAPKFFYAMDMVSFIIMVLVVMLVSTAIWYGVFPKPKKIKPLPLVQVGVAGQPGVAALPAPGSPEALALLAAPGAAAAAAVPVQLDPDEIAVVELEEGESLEDIKKRLKPKKPKIDIELLNTANSYDDKVALLRYLVSEDQQRVSQAFKNIMK